MLATLAVSTYSDNYCCTINQHKAFWLQTAVSDSLDGSGLCWGVVPQGLSCSCVQMVTGAVVAEAVCPTGVGQLGSLTPWQHWWC